MSDREPSPGKVTSGRWSHATSRFISDALVIQVGRALQVVLNLGTFVMLARGLGPRDFGVFSTIVAVLAAGAALADLGLGQLAVRAVAQGQLLEVAGVRAALPWLYLSAAGVLLASGIVSWAVTGSGPMAAAAAVLVGVSYVLAQARTGVERGYWLGALRVARATGIELVASVLRFVAVGLVWWSGVATVLRFAWGIGIAGLLTLLVTLRWLRFRPPSLPAAPPGLGRRTVRDALPFGLSSLSWNGFTESPKLLLATAAGVTAVGLYAAGARFLAAATIPLQSVLNVVTPRLFAAARGPGSTATHRRAFFRSLLGVTALGAAFALVLLLLAPVVPIMLGHDYVSAIPVLRALALSLPFQALAFAAGDWLGGIGRQHLRLLLTALTLACAVPALIFASRENGALGAAICYSVLTGLLGVSTAFACWRLIRR